MMEIVAEQRKIDIDVDSLTDELGLEGKWHIINLYHEESVIRVKVEKNVRGNDDGQDRRR